MQRSLMAASLLAALALGAPTAAVGQGGGHRFSVRNDSGETLTCRVQRRGQARRQTVVLRAGQEWTYRATSAAPRSIFCDPPAHGIRYRLEPGTAYRMVQDPHSLRIVLRAS